MLADDVQVLVEAALPVLLAIVTEVQLLAQVGEDRLTFRHHCRLLKAAPRGRRGPCLRLSGGGRKGVSHIWGKPPSGPFRKKVPAPFSAGPADSADEERR